MFNQQVLSSKTIHAQHAVVFCVVGFALIVKQSGHPFYITIMLFFTRLNQHHFYPRHAFFFFTYPMHNHTIIFIFPAKYVYCEVFVLRLKLVNLFYWCWESNATPIYTIVNWVRTWSVWILSFRWGKQC